MLPIYVPDIIWTFILGFATVFFMYRITAYNREKKAAARKRRKDAMKFKARDPETFLSVDDADAFSSWVSEQKNSKYTTDTEENIDHKKRHFLTPKKAKFPSNPKISFRPEGRWKGKSANSFFQPRVDSKFKIKKPAARSADPVPKSFESPRKPFDRFNFNPRKPPPCLFPEPKQKVNGQETELPDFEWADHDPLRKDERTGQRPKRLSFERLRPKVPELPTSEWAVFAPLTMEAIDPIYNRLRFSLRGQFFHLKDPTAGNLRWAACSTDLPEVDWDSYLEYREQRADALERLAKEAEKHPRIQSRDAYSLTKSQVAALLNVDLSEASIEEVYHTIAACTANPDPTLGFLKFISERYYIRTDIDWAYYIEHYLYRVRSPTTKSPPKTTHNSTYVSTEPKYALNERGRPVDILGNEIEYAKNKVENLSPELDIELTMSGGLPQSDPLPAEHPFRRVREKILDTPSIADSGSDSHTNVQPWRLIRGSKLPKSLWGHRYKVIRPHQPFINALQRLVPPVQLNEYWISKAALLRVMELKQEVMNRNLNYMRLRSMDRNNMDKKTQEFLDGANKQIDQHTINLLISFGGRFRSLEEITVGGNNNPYGLEYAVYPENLVPLALDEGRARWSEDEINYWKNLQGQIDHYWQFMWTQAFGYWQSVLSTIEASRVVPNQEPKEGTNDMDTDTKPKQEQKRTNTAKDDGEVT